jgi:CRISPR system Cascade subunit CasB
MTLGSQLYEESSGWGIARIAGMLSGERFPTGTRAALKRFSPGEHVPIEFYSFAYRYLPDGWEKSMDAWATIVAGIAMMSPNAHNPQVRYGQALAEKRYSEARLERLLQAEGQVQRILFLRSIRFLTQKSASFNWTDGASFILTQNRDKRESLNSRIARDYYSKVDKE